MKTIITAIAAMLAMSAAADAPATSAQPRPELRATFLATARPAISNLLIDTERQIGTNIVFMALPDGDSVAARCIFDPFRGEAQVQLRKDWQDVEVAHEIMHARMDLIDRLPVLAWRRDVPHAPEVRDAFARIQTYVKDEIVHARLVSMGLALDGEVYRPSIFDSVYANVARYLNEGRDRANDGMAHLDKIGRGTLCRVCFLMQAELLLKNYRAQLPQRRIEQTERFIAAFRAHYAADSALADTVLDLFRKHDVHTPEGHRAILAAWTKLEGLEDKVGPSSYTKLADGRIILPFPE